MIVYGTWHKIVTAAVGLDHGVSRLRRLSLSKIDIFGLQT